MSAWPWLSTIDSWSALTINTNIMNTDLWQWYNYYMILDTESWTHQPSYLTRKWRDLLEAPVSTLISTELEEDVKICFSLSCPPHTVTLLPPVSLSITYTWQWDAPRAPASPPVLFAVAKSMRVKLMRCPGLARTCHGVSVVPQPDSSVTILPMYPVVSVRVAWVDRLHSSGFLLATGNYERANYCHVKSIKISHSCASERKRKVIFPAIIEKVISRNVNMCTLTLNILIQYLLQSSNINNKTHHLQFFFS